MQSLSRKMQLYDTRKQNPLRIKENRITFPTNSINILIIHEIKDTGCQRVYGIRRHKKTNNTVSVLHPVKNNNMGGQERKRAVGKFM